jgi:hypothetical protein
LRRQTGCTAQRRSIGINGRRMRDDGSAQVLELPLAAWPACWTASGSPETWKLACQTFRYSCACQTAKRFGPTSMRKPLSRPERDDGGTSQTSIRRHSLWRSAMRGYAVAPIRTGGVAMRHVGPRDATWVPLSILT